MRLVIRHLSGRDQGRRDVLPAGRVLLGRDKACDVRFDLQRVLEVSARHAEITPASDGKAFVITDLGSTNGTWVNGEEIRQPTALTSGDEIELGSGGPRLLFTIRNHWLERLRTRLFDRRAS